MNEAQKLSPKGTVELFKAQILEIVAAIQARDLKRLMTGVEKVSIANSCWTWVNRP